ncbi:MAG: amylo-alpha-1,6-glucosidase, partial [Polyangiaceae bacterium]
TGQAPELMTSWDPMKLTYMKSLVDLAALRVYPMLYPDSSLPAAGLPWFMAVFGRDSVITSLQALPFASELAETTLKLLAMRQGSVLDDFRDEEPGKILHEARWGELTAFEERPHSPYFGSADVTPLWLILLDEYERWTGDEALVRRLEKHARAALRWIDEFGDRDGDGYVEYATRNAETGLVNQCWKDSWDSICFADGTLAELPRATCEIQGYVYDAKRRCARLAREIWGDQALADRLDSEATALRRRFNDDFWIPERGGYFALALDGKKRQVDAMTSNMGHLLWSGIADPDKADKCVRHLMSDRMFTGWGIRTLAEGEGSYNPIGYHVGTVWPHDTAFVAWGLRRYGYREHAARLAYAMFEAANCFNHRLPEAFAGYARESTRFPVEYPTACSPQAWATGAPLVMLRVMLGLVPVLDRLFVDPAVPAQIEQIELLNIRGRWGVVDAFGRGRVSLPMQQSIIDAVDGKPITPEQVLHR